MGTVACTVVVKNVHESVHKDIHNDVHQIEKHKKAENIHKPLQDSTIDSLFYAYTALIHPLWITLMLSK